MLNSNRLSNLSLIKNLINKSHLNRTANTRFYSDETAQDGEERKLTKDNVQIFCFIGKSKLILKLKSRKT